MTADLPDDWSDVPDDWHLETTEPEGLRLLWAPVPPKLAETFGYRGQGRYVGVYWEPAGDELMVDDGRSSATGEWYPFKLYRDHEHVLYEVSDYNFGYSDLDAEHWLVIDRELSLAYAALADRAREFLSDQHPPAPLLSAGQLSEARHDLERLLRDGLRKIKTSVNPADIERRVLEQHEAVQRMVAFLDNWNEEIA